jgi:hypothetical protein
VQVAQKLGAHCLVERGTYALPALFVVISDDAHTLISFSRAALFLIYRARQARKVRQARKLIE